MVAVNTNYSRPLYIQFYVCIFILISIRYLYSRKIKDIFVKVLKAPLNQILENAGATNIELINTNGDWYDAGCDEYVNYKHSGIIDPTSVAVKTITHAVSVSSVFLTTECAITMDYQKKEINEDELM